MQLNSDQIRKIARLAKLDLSPEEESLYGSQLSRVVDYIDQLERFPSVDAEAALQSEPRQEADRARSAEELDWVLSNAPQSLDRFFVVPRVKANEGE